MMTDLCSIDLSHGSHDARVEIGTKIRCGKSLGIPEQKGIVVECNEIVSAAS